MRPGQPRSSASSRGVNMQSFIAANVPSGLGVDDHVGDVRPLEADLLFDLARACVRVVEARRPFEPERQEGDEPGVGAQEAKLARLRARSRSGRRA